ncbi:MAG TPA: hypothetical protein VFC00_11330 [Micromonosporaceae bacterium]|nr:hypothetical protein [Micromonosporaceae bacterium]
MGYRHAGLRAAAAAHAVTANGCAVASLRHWLTHFSDRFNARAYADCDAPGCRHERSDQSGGLGLAPPGLARFYTPATRWRRLLRKRLGLDGYRRRFDACGRSGMGVDQRRTRLVTRYVG